jgi:hypothetical protein
MHPGAVSDRQQGELRVVDVRERHDRDGAGAGRGDPFGRGQGEAGLADTARASEGHEPVALDRDEDPHEVGVAAHQYRRWWWWYPGGRRCGPGRVACWRGGEEPVASGPVQTERVGDRADRVGVGACSHPALQLADAVDGQSGTFGQLLLRQAGDAAGLPQGLAERPLHGVLRSARWRIVRLLILVSG